MTAHSAAAGVEINAKPGGRQAEILGGDALTFLAGLHRRFNRRRLELLVRRMGRQEDFDAGKLPDFLPDENDPRRRLESRRDPRRSPRRRVEHQAGRPEDDRRRR